MRPPPLGWLVVLALACALVLAGIAGFEIRETRQIRDQIRGRVDSLAAHMARGRCVWVQSDTVRRPIR